MIVHGGLYELNFDMHDAYCTNKRTAGCLLTHGGHRVDRAASCTDGFVDGSDRVPITVKPKKINIKKFKSTHGTCCFLVHGFCVLKNIMSLVQCIP